jgi:hypothetical protein
MTQDHDNTTMLFEKYGQRFLHQMFLILVQHLGISDIIKVLDRTIQDLKKYHYDPNHFTLAAVDTTRREDYYKLNKINESNLAIKIRNRLDSSYCQASGNYRSGLG